MLELLEVEVEVAAAALAVVAAEDELPVPAMTLPWSSTEATSAKWVVIPKTALKASAWAPVFAGWPSAAVRAVWQVFFAVWSAPQLLVKVSQMNWVMMSMFCAEPWL